MGCYQAKNMDKRSISNSGPAVIAFFDAW